MKPIVTACLAAGILLALCVAANAAEDKADQYKRDAARLEQVKKIALMPVVIQARFDQGDRIPDPNRMQARAAVANRLPVMLEEKMKSGKFTLLAPEAAVLALKEKGWLPVDLYVTNVKASWDTPMETMTNKKGDEAHVLNKREDMTKTPDEMTLFKYKWHDLPDTACGLASYKMSSMARIDIERAKELGKKLGADALLYCQVADLETHTGTAGLLGEGFKSTRVHLHFTLVSSDDGTILWQAHAKGTKSQKAGIFTGMGAFKGEDRKAIEASVQAVEMLLEDLNAGSGEPAK